MANICLRMTYPPPPPHTHTHFRTRSAGLEITYTYRIIVGRQPETERFENNDVDCIEIPLFTTLHQT